MHILGIGFEFAGCVVVAINRNNITIKNPNGHCKNISFADVERWFFSGEFV